jgi:hypothetical protein
LSDHPYKCQEKKAFWKKTISPFHPMDIGDWYQKRFEFEGQKIATAGSCFAQHIGRNLRKCGFDYLDTEPAPEAFPAERALDFGYGMYSARYGNLYTSRQLLQLIKRAFGQFSPAEQYWEKDGGVVDPFRPTLEPEPFSSVRELMALQKSHLEAVVELFQTTDVFVFTLGLTETWEARKDGAVFPLCPGTAGGRYDDKSYAFRNLTSAEVRGDMEEFISIVRRINPNIRLFLTVSPVPLMATATQQQVAVATMHSKSVLRAVAGELYQDHGFVDYFPSYEIITSPFMKGYFFQPDAREVSPHGVDHVMSVFFSQHVPPGAQQGATTPRAQTDHLGRAEAARLEQVKCDEELLNSFGDN